MQSRKAEGAGALSAIDRKPTREEFAAERCRVVLEWTGDGSVISTVHGHGLPEIADAIVRRWEKVQRSSNTVHLLLDFGSMPTYETAFRKTLTHWAAEYRKKLEAIDLLSGSTLVTMGAGVANIVLGGMVRVYDSATAFDDRVRSAGLRPLPR